MFRIQINRDHILATWK